VLGNNSTAIVLQKGNRALLAGNLSFPVWAGPSCRELKGGPYEFH
jgi:hypothetical protein